MSDICPTCGLPSDLCVCETIAKEAQHIVIHAVKRRFGKLMTVVEGFDVKTINGRDLAKKLKGKLACGGTFKDGVIELQGDHVERVRDILIELGFSAETIDAQGSKFKKRGRR